MWFNEALTHNIELLQTCGGQRPSSLPQWCVQLDLGPWPIVISLYLVFLIFGTPTHIPSLCIPSIWVFIQRICTSTFLVLHNESTSQLQVWICLHACKGMSFDITVRSSLCPVTRISHAGQLIVSVERRKIREFSPPHVSRKHGRSHTQAREIERGGHREDAHVLEGSK
jgi:hypothetical protein